MRKALFPAMVGCAVATSVSAQVVDLSIDGGSYDPGTAKIAVTMTPGISSPRDLPTPALQNARRRLGQGEHVSFGLLRQMADLGDGFAAYRFASALNELDDPGLADDIAMYFGIAASTGRAGALRGMIRAIEAIQPDDEVSPARLDLLKSILLAYARAGNSLAVDAVMRFHLAEAPFGPMGDEVEKIVLDETGGETAAVSLQLATALLQAENPTRSELERARDYLVVARDSTSMGTSLIAANLMPDVEAQLAEAAETEDTK